MLTHRSMRYQIDWPMPAVYLLYHGQLHAKVKGKPWQSINASNKPQVAATIKNLARFGRSAQDYAHIGVISMLHEPMPLPPPRDRHYLPPSKAKIIGFAIAPQSKELRRFVIKMKLFVNVHDGLLAGLEIVARQGTVTYWFYAVRQDIKFTSAIFKPVGGA